MRGVYREMTQQAGKYNGFSAVVPAPFGAIGVKVDGGCVAGLVFLPEPAREERAEDAFTQAVCGQIAAYLADPAVQLDFPVACTGTVFQRRVWEAMRQIPAGQTRTYGEVARHLHSAPRAVGGACAANAIVLYYPCHRVVAANGLGGFAGERGTDGVFLRIKRWLLAHEGAV
ncbi:MAG: methylated-DNA--[protein]-cysteine S-methyltransferase [Oxalobacter formigenes]|nr:methylated-DNA--[protein]-cysteine S-methyltransferase [Oxalobacter formigenes]